MISAFLIVKNEAHHLTACLDTLSFADEIVVVDSGSEDGTPEIARRAGVRLVERPFTDFADQKNFALAHARGDWAFSIDADERVTPGLRDEILAVVGRNPPESAFRVPRRDYFRGRWMRFTWPDYQTRLLRRGAARFVGRVHETVEVDGPLGTLENPLEHLNAPSVGVFWRKIRRYAPLDASRRVEAGERFPLRAVGTQTLRELGRMIVGRAAWRDGVDGILLAALLALYAGSVSYHGARLSRRSR